MINYSCRHYKASKPCTFNKSDGSECPTCTHFSEAKQRVLFIKLDAIGDVLRSASLLPALLENHESPYIAWLTRKESAELVGMMRHVDEVIELSDLGMARITTGGWDYVYSLSNDLPSASLAALAPAKRARIGYVAENGIVTPSNAAAERWLEMAAFDRLKQENSETYQQRMFDILGYPGPLLPPVLNVSSRLALLADARIAALFPESRRPRVAINVGSGGRWPKKMLSVPQILRYARLLQQRQEVDILLVGGAAETEKTEAILAQCTSEDRIRAALTTESIGDFVATLMQADILLCGDTLAVHVASAIDLPTIAVFGPTSAAEIADFDGLIHKTWADGLDCLTCYGDCQRQQNCMSLIDVDHLVEMTIGRLATEEAVAA